jgi:hypothetical protein
MWDVWRRIICQSCHHVYNKFSSNLLNVQCSASADAQTECSQFGDQMASPWPWSPCLIQTIPPTVSSSINIDFHYPLPNARQPHLTPLHKNRLYINEHEMQLRSLLSHLAGNSISRIFLSTIVNGAKPPTNCTVVLYYDRQLGAFMNSGDFRLLNVWMFNSVLKILHPSRFRLPFWFPLACSLAHSVQALFPDFLLILTFIFHIFRTPM